MIDPTFHISNTLNLDQHPIYKTPSVMPDFQEVLFSFMSTITRYVSVSQAASLLKFGDGDYYFLRKDPVGSASPGRRALSIKYEDMKDHQEYVDGVQRNEFITVELCNLALYRNLYPNGKISFPAEYTYGLIANRWLTQTFCGRIGLIGAKEKLDLIEELMKYPQYQDYLGVERFEHYVRIPQKFACDSLEEILASVEFQLRSRPQQCSVYLVGIGHVKSGLLYRLPRICSALFIDVGSGIDALAGVIDPYRPYMGLWKNFRLLGFDYGLIDFLQYEGSKQHDIWLP